MSLFIIPYSGLLAIRYVDIFYVLHANLGGNQMQAFSKAGKIICGGILAILILALLTAAVGIFTFDSIKKLSPIIVIEALISFIGLFIIVKRLIERYATFVEKHYTLIACSMIGLVLIACIGFGYVLRITPIYDFGSVYDASVNLAETGLIYPSEGSLSDPDYFYYFPHNLGAVSVLALVFRIVKLFGGNCYFIAGMVFNALMFAGSLACIAGSIKRVLGKSNAILGLSIAMLCPLTYFVAPIFYTDGLMMLFPVLIVYLYIRFIQAERVGGKVCSCGLMVLAAVLGAMIKVTALIPFVAVCVHQIISCAVMRSGVKKELSNTPIAMRSAAKRRLTNTAMILSSAMLAAFMLFGMNTINNGFYAKQMDSSRMKELEIPKLHWVMMGFSEYGRYNGGDYDYTRAYPAGEERETAIKERVANRIRAKGFTGTVKLFAYKTTVLLGNGTLNIPDFIGLAVNKDTGLYEMTAGRDSEAFSAIARGYNLAMLLTVMCGCVIGFISLFGDKDTKARPGRRCISSFKDCVKDNAGFALLFVPIIALIGVILFFLVWETSERYIMGFMPLIMLMAATALCSPKSARRPQNAE